MDLCSLIWSYFTLFSISCSYYMLTSKVSKLFLKNISIYLIIFVRKNKNLNRIMKKPSTKMTKKFQYRKRKFQTQKTLIYYLLKIIYNKSRTSKQVLKMYCKNKIKKWMKSLIKLSNKYKLKNKLKDNKILNGRKKTRRKHWKVWLKSQKYFWNHN